MIAIIGAGMAGLACARRLADAGRDVVVFDKGRGLGGRIATRRTDLGSFDHGAQYATANGRGFEAYLGAVMAAGQAAEWPDISQQKSRFVGTPGMTALVKPLADGIKIQRSTEIVGLSGEARAWRLQLADGKAAGPFDHVVLTAPAPQALRLLDANAALFPELEHIRYAPCWTLMAAFETALDAEPVHRGDGALPWIACNSTKPERSGGIETWVAQASPEWSRQNLERDREEIAPDLLGLMGKTLGVDLPQPAYLAAHRWRYARVEQAAGQPCLFNAQRGIGIAGDGLLGGRIEAAFDSGQALAERLLEADA